MQALRCVVVSIVASSCGGAKPGQGADPGAAVDAGVDVTATLLFGQIEENPPEVALPARPTFALPVADPGFVALRALRVRAGDYLGTDVKVEGYVTWIYDCVEAVRARTKKSRAEVVRSIEADPTQCRRPTIHLGETPGEPPERGTWVVQVPRPPTKAERKYLPKAELDAWPPVPKFKKGDRVIIRGRFDLQAPGGDANTDGLIIYAGLDHVPAGAPSTVSAPTEPPPHPPLPTPPSPPRGDRTVDPGPGRACLAAVIAREPRKIADACGEAARLDPGHAGYHLWAGIAAESLVPTSPTPSEMDYSEALTHLVRALAAEPRLWRAHHTLGRIERQVGHDREAAAAFDAAIRAAPSQIDPYVALSSIYDRWRYLDEAAAVARAGTAIVRGKGAARLWVQQAVVEQQRGELAAAQFSLDEALNADDEYLPARYYRGFWAFQRGDLATARRELDVVAKATGGDPLMQRTAVDLMTRMEREPQAP